MVVAGCGGTGRSGSPVRTSLPRVLARHWAAQADAIAVAAAAGDACQAKSLAGSLRNEVVQSTGRVPARFRSPLLDGVNSLADRIVCEPVQTATKPAPAPKPPKKHGHEHGHHDHGKGGDG